MDPAQAGLKGRCPRCGQGRLFRGWLSFEDGCAACGLDYQVEDAGDGPAFFVLLFMCLVVVPLVLALHFALGQRVWLTVILAALLIIGGSLGLLRPMRGWMFGQQWKTQALEATRRDLE